MMDYKKICANCLVQANIVVGLWEGIYERSLNYGDDITNPYDVIPLDVIDGGCKQIFEICHEIDIYYTGCIDNFIDATMRLTHAFCDIIGEPFDYKYLQYDEQASWRLSPISGKYAFALSDIWLIVSEYDKLVEKYVCRENVEKWVKKWYKYYQNGGTVNLRQWFFSECEL